MSKIFQNREKPKDVQGYEKLFSPSSAFIYLVDPSLNIVLFFLFAFRRKPGMNYSQKLLSTLLREHF